ncbi:asparaginase [Bacillus aquiflavi]|uniref:Asparaginase n=1 Tax=Bacillus aquiflavi TaxID=2672567 RepID=A0A6B3VU55_9BACI|nr:asparagine synthetase A [Bacillus aquiflavi]MBA4536380.1 asparaginase [Bacillus aquiflavi]NEY80748.1 asparaginase [Bacillus aquiflavi]UAC48073.1 asparagine synthetase A [Bacillus aquiflavi]
MNKSSIVRERIFPPRSWEDLDNHFIKAIHNPWYTSLMIIQDEITYLTWEFFRNKGIRSVSLPVTTGSVTSPMGLGSDSLPVKVNLEGVETYLSDSMQFHLEYALRNHHKGVHYIMPSFRGEEADQRHLCQFYHSEAEIVGGLEDVIQLVNEYIDYLCKGLLKNIPDIIYQTAGTLKHVEAFILKDTRYPQITMEDAVMQLKNNPKYIKSHKEGFRTLTDEGEKELIKLNGGIVWVTHHDYMSVPFYQAATLDYKYALNGDLLFGIGEVVGCGERNVTKEQVRKSMKLLKVDEKNYKWYLSMKELTPLQTSGFGMGIERFILWLTNHDDIRDCQLIPRFNGKLINP